MQPITNQDFNLNLNFNKIIKFLINNKFNQLLVSKINNDPGSADMVDYFLNDNENLNIKLLENSGFENYISLAKHADLVIETQALLFEFPFKNIKSILLNQ